MPTNTWDETAPLGTALVNTVDDVIRQLKLDLRERLAASSSDFNSGYLTAVKATLTQALLSPGATYTTPITIGNSYIWFTAAGTLYCKLTSGGVPASETDGTAVGAQSNPQQTPPGVMDDYAGSSAPSGWLMCDGAAVDRTTYAALFAVIGTTYGSGNGSTTFNVPNCKGKVTVGYNSAEAEFDSLGETGGVKTVTLASSEMPVHNHSASDAGHSHTATDYGHGHTASDSGHGHGVNESAHTHTIRGSSGSGSANLWGGASADPQGSVDSATTGISIQTGYANVSVATGYASVGIATGYASITTGNAGSGGAHANLQPYITVNKIIKT